MTIEKEIASIQEELVKKIKLQDEAKEIAKQRTADVQELRRRETTLKNRLANPEKKVVKTKAEHDEELATCLDNIPEYSLLISEDHETYKELSKVFKYHLDNFFVDYDVFDIRNVINRMLATYKLDVRWSLGVCVVNMRAEGFTVKEVASRLGLKTSRIQTATTYMSSNIRTLIAEIIKEAKERRDEA